LKRLSKKKVSKKLKRLFSTLLVIDSGEIRGKKKRLHLLYEANAKVLLDFEIGNNKEVEHAEVMLEDIEGSILLADRGYWQWEFNEKMKEKMKIYVRPRGRKGKEFMEREINFMRIIVKYLFERSELYEGICNYIGSRNWPKVF
jgi:hypothetical protein